MKSLYSLALCLPLLASCQHYQTPMENTKKLTLATVQMNVKKGVSSAAVIEALGSPNMVSNDKNGLEVWVYDKFSTESSSASSGTGILPGLFVENKSSRNSQSQSTMTVIVKFDENKLVRDVKYHKTSF